MEPTDNSLPTSTATPEPMPGTDLGVADVNNTMTDGDGGVATVGSVTPESTVAIDNSMPVGAPAPSGISAAPAVPMSPVAPNPIGSPMGQPSMASQLAGSIPVNSVVNPGGPIIGGVPVSPALGAAGLLNDTEPITMPTPPKAPDPVEEELKAPMKVAGPVPGSIGSAVSMPGDPTAAINGTFNDPAAMAPNGNAMPKKKSFFGGLTGMGGDKKIDKKTLALFGVLGVALVAAIVFVVVQAL